MSRRNFISPYNPTQTMPSLNRLHTIIDIDKGRIPDNPRLQGGRVPEDTYASNPFFFGGADIRKYRNVGGTGMFKTHAFHEMGRDLKGKGFWKDFSHSFVDTSQKLGTVPLAASIATGNPEIYGAHVVSQLSGNGVGCRKCKCMKR